MDFEPRMVSAAAYRRPGDVHERKSMTQLVLKLSAHRNDTFSDESHDNHSASPT